MLQHEYLVAKIGFDTADNASLRSLATLAKRCQHRQNSDHWQTTPGEGWANISNMRQPLAKLVRWQLPDRVELLAQVLRVPARARAAHE